METTPCPRCGNETYSDPEERDVMLYCVESEKPVLVCDAVPKWRQEAMEQANEVQAQSAYDRGEDAPEPDEATAPAGYTEEEPSKK